MRTADETPVPDETLIAQICLGSKEALADLFRRYARIVRRVAYRVLRDASEADDMLQDIFIISAPPWQNFRQVKGPGAVLDSPNDLSSRYLTPAISDFAALLHAP